MFQMPAPAENSRKFQQIKQNSLHSPTDPVNDAKFAPFIYPLYIMFQMPAPAENSRKFQQIKQNLLHSPTDPVNDAKFTPFIYPLYIMFQMPDHRQRTLGNSSESSRIRSIHPQIPRIT